MTAGTFSKRECLLTAAAAVLLRLFFLAPHPSGWDDVDFALALGRYDISSMQPHFPGYPVYILAAHFFRIWTQDPFMALSLLSAFAGGLTVIPLWLLFRSWGSAGAARFTVWLYTLAPLPWISGVQPTSDAVGSFLASWLVYLVWGAVKGPGNGSLSLEQDQVHHRRSASLLGAGAALGLLLGVRVSYAPFAVLWMGAVVYMLFDGGIPLAKRLKAAFWSVIAAASVCTAWLSALILSEGGLKPFLQLAFSFTEGHFTDWGGTYRSDASTMGRAGLFFFRQIGAAGLGTLWQDAAGWRWLPTVMAAIGLLGALAIVWRRGGRGFGFPPLQAGFMLLWIVPYLLWAFFAQNVEKPRHILPLLPPLIYVLVRGWERILQGTKSRKRLFASAGLAWVAGTCAVSVPLLSEAHMQLSPMMRLAQYVQREIPAHSSLIFTWEEKRVISYASPKHTVIRLRHWDDFKKEALQYGQQPVTIYATNALLDGMDHPVQKLFEQQAVFDGSPWIYPTYHTIVLYRGTPSLIDVLREGKGE